MGGILSFIGKDYSVRNVPKIGIQAVVFSGALALGAYYLLFFSSADNPSASEE